MDIVATAHNYLANNAAESGADVLIKELADEVIRLRDVETRVVGLEALLCDAQNELEALKLKP
jgi:hypothetical protein